MKHFIVCMRKAIVSWIRNPDNIQLVKNMKLDVEFWLFELDDLTLNWNLKIFHELNDSPVWMNPTWVPHFIIQHSNCIIYHCQLHPFNSILPMSYKYVLLKDCSIQPTIQSSGQVNNFSTFIGFDFNLFPFTCSGI